MKDAIEDIFVMLCIGYTIGSLGLLAGKYLLVAVYG